MHGQLETWQQLAVASRFGETLRFGPLPLMPAERFQYRLILDSALLGTFPVIEEVAGIVP